MKVVIKLSDKQVKKLRHLVEEHNEFEKKSGGPIHNCGDVVMWDHGFSFNSNQSLVIGSNEVTLEGERCPLSQDGIFEILARLDPKVEALFINNERAIAWEKAKEFFSTLVVKEYKTSDRKLKWYQTLNEYLSGLNNEELVEVLSSLPKERLEAYVINDVGWCKTEDCVWTLFEFSNRFSYITDVDNEVKAAASLTPTEFKLWRKFRAVRAERLKRWG